MPAPILRPSTQLTGSLEVSVRRLLDAAFDGDFTDEDWQHALGGTHALLFDGDVLAAHAAVVPRTLWTAERQRPAGYVEAVAVAPEHQRRGLGTLVMGALEPAMEAFELCALSSGKPTFYERLGWQRWRGETWVKTRSGRVRTPDDDGGILVRPTALTGALDLDAPLCCLERSGDDW